MGYLPLSDVSKATSDPERPAKGTAHPAGMTIVPLYPWALDDVPYNFNSTGDSQIAGKIFSQLYVRQAVQLLVDQPTEIRKALKGYGVPTIGPVPLQPASAFTSGIDRRNPYPYDPAKAIALLEQNGWDVRPGGVSECERPGTAPGDCGAWIPAGAPLRFTLAYATGTPGLKALLSMQKASWAGAGIASEPAAGPGPGGDRQCHPLRGGSGLHLGAGGPGHGRGHSRPTSTRAARRYSAPGRGRTSAVTPTSWTTPPSPQSETGAAGLGPYFDRLAAQLPVIFEPTPAVSLTEIKNTLRGVTPQNVLGALTPESWTRAG